MDGDLNDLMPQWFLGTGVYEISLKEPKNKLKLHQCSTCNIHVNVQQDTAVVTNLWSFHNDKEFWGDPEVFRPERFLDEDGNLLKKDFSLPFGLGKRICAGETFARQYMFLLMTSIMQSFNIRCAPGTSPPTTEPDLSGIIVTKKGLWTRFEPRAWTNFLSINNIGLQQGWPNNGSWSTCQSRALDLLIVIFYWSI